VDHDSIVTSPESRVPSRETGSEFKTCLVPGLSETIRQHHRRVCGS
jgi:hypothetical protein